MSNKEEHVLDPTEAVAPHDTIGAARMRDGQAVVDVEVDDLGARTALAMQQLQMMLALRAGRGPVRLQLDIWRIANKLLEEVGGALREESALQKEEAKAKDSAG